ncbi:MAG: hypothetical protein FWF44_02145, partial [Defluviitaleaceae bacterium]|nr:hypothetical protein [Defluviitaleaceae bacterium]
MSGKSPPPGWGGFPRNGNRKLLWALLAVAILSVTVTASYSFLTIPMSTVANSFGLGATDITVDEPNVDDPGDVPLGPDAKNV